MRDAFLDALDANSAAVAQSWADYYDGWVRWNHARSGAAIAGSATYIASLLK